MARLTVTFIAKEGWEVFDAAGETPSESFTYTPDYNETDGVVTTSQTLSVQTEGGITVDGSPLIYDFDYKARYDKRITEFVEQVDNLGSNPSLDELSDVMKYYDDLPEYIKDRLKENVGATVALEELTTLLDDKEDDIKTAVEVAIDEADSIADIERAKILYDALDDAAKEEIPNKDLLDKKQEDAEKAQNIIDILNELNPGGSYEEKKSALELYDDLTDDQKALIDDKGDHVEVAGAVAAVDGVIDLLENIEKPYSAQDLDEIQAAQDAFDALTNDQKAMIPQADRDKLDSEYNEIVNSMTEDEKAVEDFERLVNEVKEKPTADAIEKLEDAFNKLTPDQKNTVNSGVEDTYDDFVVLGERSASPGGGSTSSSYTPERNDPDNGDYTVTPSAPKKGDAVTIKPESDEGYIVDKVVVKDNNGEDIEVTVNVDGTYTFVQPSGKVTITVTFKEVAVGVKLDKENHIAYMNGVGDGKFAPDKNMTRAEVVVMFSRLMVEKMDDEMTYTATFTDITGDEWYANAIGYLQQFDIVGGYVDGTFRPNQPITRAEFATIASRFETFVKSDTNNFSDVADDYWALPYINSVAEQGFVNGYPDGTFKPMQNITRAEAVTVVNNMLERTADEAFIADNMAELTTFVDVDSEHWAYYQILEASNGHEHAMSEGKETWTELH